MIRGLGALTEVTENIAVNVAVTLALATDHFSHSAKIAHAINFSVVIFKTASLVCA